MKKTDYQWWGYHILPAKKLRQKERVAQGDREIRRITSRVEQIAERDRSLSVRVKDISKKYGVTVTPILLAAGIAISAVISALKKAWKPWVRLWQTIWKRLGIKLLPCCLYSSSQLRASYSKLLVDKAANQSTIPKITAVLFISCCDVLSEPQVFCLRQRVFFLMQWAHFFLFRCCCGFVKQVWRLTVLRVDFLCPSCDYIKASFFVCLDLPHCWSRVLFLQPSKLETRSGLVLFLPSPHSSLCAKILLFALICAPKMQ